LDVVENKNDIGRVVK